ncbi:hypothetical protein IQ268_21175 [Oculatella sp. LEGE 06141]|uniref:hypothetical protein n=1 Tax=Oculatella sp. LEGE 06141 TaxID=1828648 RepID=UPI001882138A|nr:hypothetical protein [Oculatella sp. LEGE 06141]MBE9181076.1 hypothetical protein [Oculatella sp. LEGE 06141]
MVILGLILLAAAWGCLCLCLQTRDEIWAVIAGVAAVGCFILGLVISPLLIQVMLLVAALYIEKFIPLLPSNSKF